MTDDLVRRLGVKFQKAMEEIKDARRKLGKDDVRLANGKLTDQIIKHNSWSTIKEDLINFDFIDKIEVENE